MSQVEEHVFDEPSGSVLGYVTAFMEVKNGKKKRVAHATLLTLGGADVVLEVPRKVAVSDIPVLVSLLNDFAARVQALSAGSEAACKPR